MENGKADKYKDYPKRVKIVLLSYRFFEEALGFLQRGIWKYRARNPLPADARIVGFDKVASHAAIGVLVESASSRAKKEPNNAMLEG